MKKHGHSWWMMAGCCVMMVGVFVLPALGVKLGGVLPILLVLACPISMVLMMGSMGKGHYHSEHGEHCSSEESTDMHTVDGPAQRPLPVPRDRE